MFVEELAGALALPGRLRSSAAGIELASGADLPIPDTLRDAVLLRLDGLPEPALRLLHLAVVAGRRSDRAAEALQLSVTFKPVRYTALRSPP